jgi:hypothetical protein
MSLPCRLWHRVKQAYVFLLPLRFNVLALGILIFAFRFSDQGRDILRALGEERDHPYRFLFLFIAISNVLAYEVWYWSRHLLRYRPNIDPDNPCWDPMRDPLPRNLPWTNKWIPRLLGVCVFAIEIAGFLKVKSTPTSIFVWLVVSALVYWAIVVMRRDVFPKLFAEHKERISDVSDFAAFTRAMFIFAAVVELGLFAWAFIAPVTWWNLGVAATLVLTIAVWIPLGTFLVGVGEKWRFPLLGALLVWAVLISRCTDNHVIRSAGPVLNRPSLEQALDAWYARTSKLHPGGTVPLIIVGTEGGGIRAAYWTATALTAATDRVPPFADHCFAISGVSGGSLGALIYDAILARRLAGVAPNDPRSIAEILGNAPNLQGDVRRILKFDALSGTLAALAQPDLTQRFVPIPKLPDREKALEEGWERGWSTAFDKDELFGGPFLATMQKHAQLPNLFLNGTVVETGERIVTSNVHVLPALPFRNAFDAFDQLQFDIPLSTAAGMSARFTYVSPAGKIPYNGADKDKPELPATCTTGSVANPRYHRDLFGHVVDGGYFENSGAVSAAELVQVVMDLAIHKHYKIQPFVMLIDHWDTMAPGNCPTDATPFCPAFGMCGPPVPLNVERFMNEVMSPLRGVLNARDARGRQAIGDIAQVMRNNIVELRLAPTRQGEEPLPLGWVLSDQAMNTLDAGVQNQAGNRVAIENIGKLLAAQEIQKPDCDTAQCGKGVVVDKGSSYGSN